jgi:hypothetical protein
MSTEIEQVVEPEYSTEQEDESLIQYRALSSGAVVALVLGLISLVALGDYWLVVVPLVGVAFGLMVVRQLRARRHELTGLGLAWTGVALSAAMIPLGPAVVYYQEVSPIPPGYRYISYDELQPNPQSGELIPRSALDLIGKKVYIKGFVFAGSDTAGIRKLLLVRDAGTCCFGGNPKITDRIVVSLGGAATAMYTKQVARVAGTFRVSRPEQAPGASGQVFYFLDQAEMR